MSLKWRLLTAFFLLCSLIISLLLYTSYNSFRSTYHELQQNNLVVLANAVSSKLSSETSITSFDEIESFIRPFVQPNHFYLLKNEDKSKLISLNNFKIKTTQFIEYINKETNNDYQQQGGDIVEDNSIFLIKLNLQLNNNSLYLIQIEKYEVYSEFIRIFGKPIFFTSLLIIWISFWLAITLATLINTLSSQKIELKEQSDNLSETINKVESANKAKSEFLSNMSHELRTPIHAILSYASFGIKRDKVSPEKRKSYFNKIHKSGSNLLYLLNDLLDLSKLESGKMEFHKSSNCIKEITIECIEELQLLLDAKNLILNTRFQNELFIIHCDKHVITQVIRNLLSNAIKFTPENKQITIKLTLRKSDTIREAIKIKTSVLRFEIEDQGIGIPENELTKVFEKFIQSSTTATGSGGTGLGLAICKENIAAHSGTIWAESTQGKGSRFIFEIPIE